MSLYGKFIRKITLLLSVILLMLAVQHISVKADYNQGYPNPTEKKYVNDYAGVIDEASEQYIVNAGEELEQKNGSSGCGSSY